MYFLQNTNSLGQFVLLFSLLIFQLTGTVRNFVSGGQEHAQEGLQEHAQVVLIAHPRSLLEQSCVF